MGSAPVQAPFWPKKKVPVVKQRKNIAVLDIDPTARNKVNKPA
jgi:hypothetical protein